MVPQVYWNRNIAGEKRGRQGEIWVSQTDEEFMEYGRDIAE